jgi:hypothetical protein
VFGRAVAASIFGIGVAMLVIGALRVPRLSLLGYGLMVLATALIGSRPFHQHVTRRAARRSREILRTIRAARRRRRFVVWDSGGRHRRAGL